MAEPPPNAAMDFASQALLPIHVGRDVEPGARLRGTRTPGRIRLLDPPCGRTVLLLALRRRVASDLTKSDRYVRSPLWLRRNVHPVLREVWRG